MPVGERKHCPGRVATDTWELTQTLRSVGQAATVPSERLAGDHVQPDGANIVAEWIPQAPDLSHVRGGQAAEGRETAEELAVLRDHALDLRLLQHDLGDEDAIRLTGATPREVAGMLGVPDEQSPLEGTNLPRVGAGQGHRTQSSTRLV